MLRRALLVVAALRVPVHAEGNCTTIDIDFVPAVRTNPPEIPPSTRFDLQIVAWLERADGTFVDTLAITQDTGTFGLGNRPGRFDFNSGPDWPYGRRETVFPVWSHRHGLSWPLVVFQPIADQVTDPENLLSHPVALSSLEQHYCRPQIVDDSGEWDGVTDATSCASPAFTDKGRLDPVKTSLYPPRADLVRGVEDDATVAMFATLNPFDAVSTATPRSGSPATLSWPVPQDLPLGDYVVFVEVAREFDPNATYTFGSPVGIPFQRYGESYRGQPSLVYRIPFAISDVATTARTSDYAGYGAPDGHDGMLRPPDTTITAGVPGSGIERFALVSDATGPYRVRISSTPQLDLAAPDAPLTPQVVRARSSGVAIAFVAPGDDGVAGGKAAKYEIRIRTGEPITDASFAASPIVATRVVPAEPGAVQLVEVPGLLPETTYSVGIRAIDDCNNVGALATLAFTTPAREAGTVDACFIATAAYGSAMSADVDRLRRFRDRVLRTTVLGELAVEAYYTFGPSVAGVVGESDLLRATARGILAPVVARAR